MTANTELNDDNLIKAINMKVITVAAYAMNICKFNVSELKELDQTIKRELRGQNMLGKQTSNEQFYLKREKGGRELKLLRDTFQETRLRVACYMYKLTSRWIEKRDDQRGECNRCGIGEDNGGSWSETGL